MVCEWRVWRGRGGGGGRDQGVGGGAWVEDLPSCTACRWPPGRRERTRRPPSVRARWPFLPEERKRTTGRSVVNLTTPSTGQHGSPLQPMSRMTGSKTQRLRAN